MKRNLFKFVGLLAAIILLAGAFQGCTQSPTPVATAAPTAIATAEPTPIPTPTAEPTPAPPLKFSWMIQVWGEAIASDNPVLLALDKYLNADIQMISVPVNAYDDKINVSMASQQVPDVMVVPNIKTTTFVNAATGGLFWEVGPYFKQFSSFSQISPVILRNASTDGKNYGIPRERQLARRVVTYRIDWLKKAGVAAPDSLDTIYAAAKAFAAGDYDGDGKTGDTVGLALQGAPMLDGMSMLVVALGGFTNWGDQGGQLVPAYTTSQYMDAMNWLKKMYDEKLINLDFATEKDPYTDLLEKDKCGMYFDYACSYNGDGVVTAAQQKDPSLKTANDVIDQVFLKGPDGNPRISSENGIMGAAAISKLSVKTEADLLNLMGVLNKLDDKTAANLMTWGVEGVHYNMVDGVEKVIDADKEKNEVTPLAQLGFAIGGSRATQDVNWSDDPLQQKNYKEQRDYAAAGYCIPDLSAPYSSDTYGAQGSTLDTIINDATIKYIMGLIDVNGWNDAVAQWKAQGGDKVIAEYNAQYASSK